MKTKLLICLVAISSSILFCNTAFSDVLCAKTSVKVKIKRNRAPLKPSQYFQSTGTTCPTGYEAIFTVTIPVSTAESAVGTLSSGKSLTGVWNVNGGTGNTFAGNSISFQKALASAPSVEVVRLGTSGTNCTGTAAAPTAPAGYLCVYESTTSNIQVGDSGIGIYNFTGTGGNRQANKEGAVIYAYRDLAAAFYAWGSWAVTGN